MEDADGSHGAGLYLHGDACAFRISREQGAPSESSAEPVGMLRPVRGPRNQKGSRVHFRGAALRRPYRLVPRTSAILGAGGVWLHVGPRSPAGRPILAGRTNHHASVSDTLWQS